MEKELFILGLIRHNKMHGYLIIEHIHSHFDVIVSITKPTAYRLLHKMADKGWVSLEQEQEGKRPVRQVYSITEKGEVAFQSLLRKSLGAYNPISRPSAVSLAFIKLLPAEEISTLMEKRKQLVLGLLENLNLASYHQKDFHLVFSHQRCHLEAELDWIKFVFEEVHKPPS